MEVARYDKDVVTQSDLSAFYLARMILPRICPQLHVSGQCFRIVSAQVVHQYLLVSVVAVPPFILQLLIGLRPLLSRKSSLARPRFTPNPFAFLFRFAGRDHLVIFRDLSE